MDQTLPGRQSITAQLLNESVNFDRNQLTGQPYAKSFKQPNFNAQLNSRGPQRGFQTQSVMFDAPSEFAFEYNFDENGVLYYLGSLGKRRNWQNPHALGQVRAFASSLGNNCNVDSFVGRSVTNCRTEDEPFSFFGVDLGTERRLVPTHYTLRNRNSPTHVVKNWYLEASVTGASWMILDARIYGQDAHSQDAMMNPNSEHEFREL